MTSPFRPRMAVAVAVAVATVLTCGGCTSDAKSKPTSAAASTPAPASTSASTSESTPVARPAPRNPFTGIGPVPANPVIAVKIDDTAPGRPQRSIDQADIVYIIEVEGGLTRLAAIYATHLPKVGYVRSTRPSDPDLLRQFGKITEAFSGGARDSLMHVRVSGIKGWSNDAGAPYFWRVSRAGTTYINLVLDLAKVAKRTRTNRPRPMGFTFSTSLAALGAGAKGTDIRTRVGSTDVEFKYDPHTHRYVRYIGGVRQVAADGKPVTAANVVVQSCKIVTHPQDVDVNGNPSQWTYTIGSGAVSVFRNGRRYDGTWTRASLAGGTVLKTTTGTRITLAPGDTWVALVRRGTRTLG